MIKITYDDFLQYAKKVNPDKDWKIRGLRTYINNLNTTKIYIRNKYFDALYNEIEDNVKSDITEDFETEKPFFYHKLDEDELEEFFDELERGKFSNTSYDLKDGFEYEEDDTDEIVYNTKFGTDTYHLTDDITFGFEFNRTRDFLDTYCIDVVGKIKFYDESDNFVFSSRFEFNLEFDEEYKTIDGVAYKIYPVAEIHNLGLIDDADSTDFNKDYYSPERFAAINAPDYAFYYECLLNMATSPFGEKLMKNVSKEEILKIVYDDVDYSERNDLLKKAFKLKD